MDIPSRASVAPARFAEGFGGNGCFKVAQYTAERRPRNRQNASLPKCHIHFSALKAAPYAPATSPRVAGSSLT